MQDLRRLGSAQRIAEAFGFTVDGVVTAAKRLRGLASCCPSASEPDRMTSRRALRLSLALLVSAWRCGFGDALVPSIPCPRRTRGSELA